MGDSDIKSETGQGEDALPIELTSRLMRRRTEPLGTIDVRHPRQLYERTAGWVARRFALLDRWKTRYGSDEGSGSAQANLVFNSLGRTSAEPGAMFTSQAQLPREMKQVKAPQSIMASQVSPPSPELFQVRRHGGPRISPSQTATPPQAEQTEAEQRSRQSADSPVVKTDAPASAVNAPSSVASNETKVSRTVDVTPVAGPENLPHPRSAEITETAQGSNENPVYTLRRSPRRGVESEIQDPDPGGAEKNLAQKTGDYPLARHGAPAPPKMSEEQTPAGNQEIAQPLDNPPPTAAVGPVRVMPLSRPVNAGEVSSAPAPLVQRRLNEADASPTKVARARELTATERSLPSKQISSANPSTGIQRELPSPTTAEGATSRITTPAAQGGIEPGTGASPVATNSAPSLPLLQRQSAPGAGRGANRQTAPPDETAATPEIRVGPSVAPKPPLVWRASAAGTGGGGDDRSESPPSNVTTGKTKVARQTGAVESTPAPDAESATRTVTAPTAPPVKHPDVVQLAEQVSRILARQLAVECERRGRRGWS
jgi:hypothetical protein